MDNPFDTSDAARSIYGDAARSYLSPFALFVDSNYRLRFTAWCSQAGVTLALRYRFLRANDAELVDAAEQLVPTSNRVATVSGIPLPVGFLLNVEVFALAGTPARGTCFAKVELIRGADAVATVVASLVQGYVTANNAKAWPGGTLESSLDGPGAILSITVANPAAGAEISETMPAGTRRALLAFRMQLLTSATVANRQKALVLDDGATEYHRTESSNNQAAATTFLYSHAQGHAAGSAGVGNTVHGHLPGNIRLAAGHRVRTVTGAIQVGDQYSAIQYLVEEWLTAD